MRQAGRYLPEYNDVRLTGGADFFTICKTKELAAKITLQPIERYPLDAAIIFTDILVVPQALGLEVQMLKGEGPHFPAPLLTPDDLSRLLPIEEAFSALNYVYEAITLTRQLLDGKVPLIGFCGAPWTLMSYMIEGGGSKTFAKAKSWLYKWPEATHRLMRILTDILIIYLDAQVKAGAQLLQVFDSWAGELSPNDFRTFALPYLKEIAEKTKEKHPQLPLIIFAKGANYALEDLKDSKYDVIGLDWTVDPAKAREIVGEGKSLQGNMDPCVLYGDKETIFRETAAMIKSFGTNQRWIANLGHGLHPTHNPVHVGYYIEAIQTLTSKQD